MATKKEAPAGAKPAPAGEADKKSSKGKLIVMIVLLLFILGGAGGGWYWWAHVKNADEASEGEGSAKKKKKKKEQGPTFVSLDAFTVNLRGEDNQLLQIAITLQLSDEEDAAKLKQYMPLVRSRLVLLLSSKRAEEILTAEGKVKLEQEVAEQIKQPFYQGDYPLEIQNVLFTSFIVQ